MLNSAFSAFSEVRTDYYPVPMRSQIDLINNTISKNVNLGVYAAGFVTTQKAYNRAFNSLFLTLDNIDNFLGKKRYLVGTHITEADLRLFTTLVRFDVAYYGAFKCNKKRLVDYLNRWPYTRELYQLPGIGDTVDLVACKERYHSESPLTNPLGIIPKGPIVEFSKLTIVNT